MPTEYKRQMLLIGPREEVMKMCVSYFPSLGYAKTESGASSWVRFKKEIGRWDSTKDEIGRSHFLTIKLESITLDKTNVVFHFQTIGLTGKGEWNTKSVMEADRLLMHLSNLLSLKFEEPKTVTVQPVSQPGHREKIVEREVVVKVKCHYCGALNDQMNQKCSSCGARI